jgi:DNA-binding beta-propeller fold protein YncE
MNIRSLVAIACVVCFLAGCNATSSVPPIAPATLSSQASHRDGKWHLYVANRNSTISIYDPGGTAPVETISKNLNDPAKIKFSEAGSLYVLNCDGCGYYDNGSVTVYGAHSHTFLRSISDGLDGPADIALDSTDNLYVANRLGNSVTVYPPGGTKVVRTITAGIAEPQSLAIDSSDRIYVANCPNSCSGFSGGTVTVYGRDGDLLETIPNLEGGGPITIGPNGDLYAEATGNSDTKPSFVGVFPWGSTRPIRKMLTDITVALAVDPTGDTYVTDCNFECGYDYSIGGYVQEFGPKGYPIRMLVLPEDVPNGLALDPNGNLYVSFEYSPVAGYAPRKRKPFVLIKNGVNFSNDLAIGP